MGTRHLVALAAAVVAVTTVTAAGQAIQAPGSSRQGPAAAGSPQPTARKAYVVPRTADGQPDFQGVWANNTITPLQRPPQWAGKQFLTDQEMAALKKAAASAVTDDSDAVFGDSLVLAAIANEKGRSFEPSTGNYNNFWLVEREVDNRTALIVDPADGRIPPLTPEAQDRRPPSRRRDAAVRPMGRRTAAWASDA